MKLNVKLAMMLVVLSGSVLLAAEVKIRPVLAGKVKVTDSFWGGRLTLWQTVTVNDVLDKFENDGAIVNFDRVAAGEKGGHRGAPWFDGLIYETIQGASDLLAYSPDAKLSARLDGIIDRIVAAQNVGTDGYVMTYTQLMEPGHRWGLNGGMLRWQHDIYNAGAMVAAGVHHYKATGSEKLLNAAVKIADCMVREMGPAPKRNLVPSHSLPEESLIELARLWRQDSKLSQQPDAADRADSYQQLAEFWIANRGNHCGLPTTQQWATDGGAAEKFVREVAYADGRPSWGHYAQDETSIFDQPTIEGHAVRATLLCAGMSATAAISDDIRYAETSTRLWKNMVSRRMHITGGVGAFAHEEKFGSDYQLPQDAYLETCAAVGAGFFHYNMHLLTGYGRYVDELERTLYNNVLNGVSWSGDHYTYENPLVTNERHRWDWHGCPCCPPMFLKLMGQLPSIIYSQTDGQIFVNLYIASDAQFDLDTGSVLLMQQGSYTQNGRVSLVIMPESEMEFTLAVRIPGWSLGKENFANLYRRVTPLNKPVITVNEETLALTDIKNGYAFITRKWQPKDKVELKFDVSPRLVVADDNVTDNAGCVALASGPFIYAAENCDNGGNADMVVPADNRLELKFDAGLCGGINRILVRNPEDVISIDAIPFFCQDNRPGCGSVRVWLKAEK